MQDRAFMLATARRFWTYQQMGRQSSLTGSLILSTIPSLQLLLLGTASRGFISLISAMFQPMRLISWVCLDDRACP